MRAIVALSKSTKVYFMTHPKNIEKSVPKSGILTFETYRKSPPLFGTDWRYYGQQNLWIRTSVKP